MRARPPARRCRADGVRRRPEGGGADARAGEGPALVLPRRRVRGAAADPRRASWLLRLRRVRGAGSATRSTARNRRCSSSTTLARRHPAMFEATPTEPFKVRTHGRPVAAFATSGGLEVYAGSRVIVVFGDSAERTLRAAHSLRVLRGPEAGRRPNRPRRRWRAACPTFARCSPAVPTPGRRASCPGARRAPRRRSSSPRDGSRRTPPRQGARSSIHAFVVRTAHSYVTAVPSGAAKSLERAGALESALGARVDQVRPRRGRR